MGKTSSSESATSRPCPFLAQPLGVFPIERGVERLSDERHLRHPLHVSVLASPNTTPLNTVNRPMYHLRLAVLGEVPLAGAYTRPFFSSTSAVSDTKYTVTIP